MAELLSAVSAIHKGFTMTGYEWEPQWISHCSQAEPLPEEFEL